MASIVQTQRKQEFITEGCSPSTVVDVKGDPVTAPSPRTETQRIEHETRQPDRKGLYTETSTPM